MDSGTEAKIAGSVTPLVEGKGQTAAAGAEAASRRYRLLGACLQYPDQDLADELAAGDLDDLLGPVLGSTSDTETLQVEYTRLFDPVGASGPLCSLNAGDYAEHKLQVVEEVLRFYDHFGLVPPEQYRVMPDHLTAELEFLHFLAYTEAGLLAQGADPAAYRRAQRDFLQRQILSWLPRLIEQLSKNRPAKIFLAIIACLAKTVDSELERLDVLLAATSQ